jgi:hypothetical protein
MNWRTLRLAREEPGQVLRLQAFRAVHPEVIIGDAGFGVWQARIPQPDGERIISRYALRELLDKLDQVTGEGTASGSAD